MIDVENIFATSLNPEETSTYPGGYKPLPHHFERLAEELSKLHEGASSPAENICETPEYYKIELAAPGLKREDFFVSINENGNLSISALHKVVDSIQNEAYSKHSFNYECFTREFLLPENIDVNFNIAEYKQGILSIWFLKTERPYPKRVLMIMVY